MKYYNFENLMNDCLTAIKDIDLNSAQGKEQFIPEFFKVFNEYNKLLLQIISKGTEELHETYMEMFSRIGESLQEQKEYNEIFKQHNQSTSDFINKQLAVNDTLINLVTNK